MGDSLPTLFDVGIVGGGPAGLSAAIVLGRACRRVILIDDGRPRNSAARAVHGYLSRDGVTPSELREHGRREALVYGVKLVDGQVTSASRRPGDDNGGRFELAIGDGPAVLVRRLLLATGVRDCLPEIENMATFYGKSVHHCPYCDGWEHRDRRLAALGKGDAVAELALSLLGWSRHVIACTNGAPVSRKQQEKLSGHGIEVRTENLIRLEGRGDVLERLVFDQGPASPCDALFFSADQVQRSKLPELMGCKCDDQGVLVTRHKQSTDCSGLYVAGDADGDVQFAIVAAAEGAIAATAINRELLAEDASRVEQNRP